MGNYLRNNLDVNCWKQSNWLCKMQGRQLHEPSNSTTLAPYLQSSAFLPFHLFGPSSNPTQVGM